MFQFRLSRCIKTLAQHIGIHFWTDFLQRVYTFFTFAPVARR